MTINLATCNHVEGGDTFRTALQTRIRLARYDAPEEGHPDYIKAKQLLSSVILDKEILYEYVGTSYGPPVAEVWRRSININDIMLRSGFKRK
ncbi:thermonuclease family protein [Chloroflexota bacterium]